MTSGCAVSESAVVEPGISLPSGTTANSSVRVHFPNDCGFYATVRERVAEYLRQRAGDRPQGGIALWLKAVLILGLMAVGYILLVFVVTTWVQAVALAMVMGGLAALVGFNIQHDGGHQAASRYPWLNRIYASALDLVGASSYLWHWKHSVFHHGYSNISGKDTDINVGRVLRLEPHQPLLRHHRWQHVYIWFLYGLMAVRWQMYDDFREIVTGRIGPHRIPRPRGGEMALFIIGKVIFFSLVLVVPMLFHPVWVVLLLYILASYILGTVLSIVFQLAHNTALSEFPMPVEANGKMACSWAEHQLRTTADFSRRNWVMTWLLGGLNYQIEHHLFPQVSHIHYPALSPIVEATCREYGITYHEHPTFAAGLRAHFAWLREMGRRPLAG